MNDIPMPKISSAFTIEDIRKIRAWNYERHKGMTPEEICEDTRKGAERFETKLVTPVDPAIHAEVDRLLQSAKRSEKVLA